MSTNLVSYYVDTTARAARAAEVPNASFSNGANNAASNANGIGVTTGSYNFKESDWPRPAASSLLTSQQIGETRRNLFVNDATLGADSLTSLVKAAAPVAPDATIATVSGKAMKNRTGVTIPADGWTFGVADNA
jgi:hypothetical protein